MRWLDGRGNNASPSGEEAWEPTCQPEQTHGSLSSTRPAAQPAQRRVPSIMRHWSVVTDDPVCACRIGQQVQRWVAWNLGEWGAEHTMIACSGVLVARSPELTRLAPCLSAACGSLADQTFVCTENRPKRAKKWHNIPSSALILHYPAIFSRLTGNRCRGSGGRSPLANTVTVDPESKGERPTHQNDGNRVEVVLRLRYLY